MPNSLTQLPGTGRGPALRNYVREVAEGAGALGFLGRFGDLFWNLNRVLGLRGRLGVFSSWGLVFMGFGVRGGWAWGF